MVKPLCVVTEGIYQVRGLEISDVTLVEGDRGVIIIDPPASTETAAAATCLYRAHRGDRPVTAVIYTHFHGDHFGGAAGVTDDDVSIIAPIGFMEHALRSFLYPPTLDITHTGQEETIDGVRVVFQLTPGTAMNFLFPQRNALYITEYSTETIALFGARADVVFASNHRPIRGNSTIMRYLAQQRDAHAYLHDQTVRLLGKGHTGTEIAEIVQLPPVLEKGYHGSISYRVQAIYDRYLGRFDGNPAGLWQHPPVETAKRYVECFGGVGNAVAEAREFVASGDLRFAAQLLQHAVFASPDDEAAKQLLIQVYERLGHRADNSTWSDFYLTGAQELRFGVTVTPDHLGTGMASALSVEQIFDTVAVRVDGPAAWHETLTIDWVFADGPYRTTLRHGVLIHHPRGGDDAAADLTLRLSKAELLGLLAGQGPNGIPHEGDPAVLKRLLSHLDPPGPMLGMT